MWLSICGKLHLSFILRLQHRQKLGRANVYSLSLKVNQVQLPQECAAVPLYPNSPPKNVNPWIPVLDIYLTMPNTSNMTITEKLDSPSPRGWLRVLVATWLKTDRMDLTGARWTMRGAEAVLPLGSLYISGDWDEYWQFHLQQEHKPNHLALYSSGIALSKQVLKANLFVLLPLHLFQYLSKFHSRSY